MLSPLALQDVPIQVISGLKSLSQFLPQHLTNSLGSFDRMLQVKLQPAQSFCNLLDRLIRANEACLNASKILVDPIETRKMREDWSRFVDPKAIVQREVPCGGADAQKIFGDEIVQLLAAGELGEDLELEILKDVSKREGSFANGEFPQQSSETASGAGENRDGAISKSEVVVLKWAQYLSSLPWRFPQVPPRLFLLCMSGLLTASLRDISMNGGEGFGAWWVVRCWIDEWMGWSAEMGGFLSMKVAEQQSKPRGTDEGKSGASRTPEASKKKSFETNLGFHGGSGLGDSTSTETLLASQEPTQLVFPTSGGDGIGRKSDEPVGDLKDNGEERYGFITTTGSKENASSSTKESIEEDQQAEKATETSNNYGMDELSRAISDQGGPDRSNASEAPLFGEDPDMSNFGDVGLEDSATERQPTSVDDDKKNISLKPADNDKTSANSNTFINDDENNNDNTQAPETTAAVASNSNNEGDPATSNAGRASSPSSPPTLRNSTGQASSPSTAAAAVTNSRRASLNGRRRSDRITKRY